jgi:hypothetical protein
VHLILEARVAHLGALFRLPFDVGFVCGDWLRLRKMGKIIVTQPFYSCRYYHPRAVAAQARPASALASTKIWLGSFGQVCIGFDLGDRSARNYSG